MYDGIHRTGNNYYPEMIGFFSRSICAKPFQIVEGKLSIENSVKIMRDMEKNLVFLKIIEDVSIECSTIDEVDR